MSSPADLTPNTTVTDNTVERGIRALSAVCFQKYDKILKHFLGCCLAKNLIKLF